MFIYAFPELQTNIISSKYNHKELLVADYVILDQSAQDVGIALMLYNIWTRSQKYCEERRKITDNSKAISSAFGSLNVTKAVLDCPCSLHPAPKSVNKRQQLSSNTHYSNLKYHHRKGEATDRRISMCSISPEKEKNSRTSLSAARSDTLPTRTVLTS